MGNITLLNVGGRKVDLHTSEIKLKDKCRLPRCPSALPAPDSVAPHRLAPLPTGSIQLDGAHPSAKSSVGEIYPRYFIYYIVVVRPFPTNGGHFVEAGPDIRNGLNITEIMK
ncbi:MAG: hypothetical protein JO068_18525 [Hyphomicrobiales bacterium]|nr:hypothetical protein [Hyphomicrobiales bacterium]